MNRKIAKSDLTRSGTMTIQISQALELIEAEISSKAIRTTRNRTIMPLTLAKMQLLVPCEPWNWPTDSLGTSSAELFKFCAWMPDSPLKSILYSRSGTKFSDMYEGFLNALDNVDAVEKARSDLSNQKNYTLVLYGQSDKQLEPAWNVSQFPAQWTASVSSGSSTAGKVRVNLESVGEKADKQNELTLFGMGGGSFPDETPLPLSQGQCKYVEIYADAWGYIEISPANWYNSSVVEINAKGPYKRGYAGSKKLAVDPEITTWFFGENGLLRCILTGIYVALNPKVTASVNPELASKLQDKLQQGKKLRVAGLFFSKQDITFPDVTSRSTGPVTIVATKNAGSTVKSTRSGKQDAVLIGATVAELGKQTL